MAEQAIYFFIMLGITVVPVAWAVFVYNSLVGLRNNIRESWSNIDTELKRRYELIPNLVSTVRGYAAHERDVLDRVTELRNQCEANRGSITDQAADEQQLVQGMRRLLAVVENYPDLKADENFRQLQTELVNTEDRIQASRRFFNGNVRDYRNKCEQFPTSLVAGMFGFQPQGFFDVEPSVRETPSADFTGTETGA